MQQKYVKLFESFEDSEEMMEFPTGSADHTKSWMMSVEELDNKIGQLRQVMDQMNEVNLKILELQKELKLSEIKQHEERLIEDIKLAMESINKSNHKVHGLILKHRKGTLRWNPPSQKLMLEIIELELEGGKELIEKLKTESAFKQPVDVKSSLSIKREGEEEVSEAEEMSVDKPWYKKVFDKISGWLSSFRRKAIDTSVKLEELVSEFEESLETTKSSEEINKEREIEILRRKALSRGIY
jgi:hypothetical protein